MAKVIVLGSSAAFPLPRTETNKFEDYLDVADYQRNFELHDDNLCNSAKQGGKDRRTRASLAIVAPKGTILIDAGPDIKYQLKKHGLKWPDAVFITHEHLDANYGLRYLPKNTPIFSEKLDNIKHGEPVEMFGVEILPFRVVHSEIAPFTAYRFKLETGNWKLKTFAYITDISSVRGIRKYVQDCNILFADGSILKRDFGGHLSMVNQLKYYKKWGLKKVIFTHIGHATLPHEKLVEYLKSIYPQVDVAFDGMAIEV